MSVINVNTSQCLLFFDTSTSIWSRVLHKDFKHCVLLAHSRTHNMSYSYGLYDTGLNIRQYKCTDFNKAIKLIPGSMSACTHYIKLIRGEPAKITCNLPGMITCNEFVRYISRINIGFTLTPKSLYDKVLGKEYYSRNYLIEDVWNRN